MSSILLKIVTGAMHLKNNRREAKNMMEEVEKDLHGLGIVKPVHRFQNYFFLRYYRSKKKEPHWSKVYGSGAPVKDFLLTVIPLIFRLQKF